MNPEMSFQYATGMCLLLENVGGCVNAGRPQVVTLNICYNWPVLFSRRMWVNTCHSIAYSLSNISAKNYRNRLMWVESIACNISVVFLRHSVKSGSRSSLSTCFADSNMQLFTLAWWYRGDSCPFAICRRKLWQRFEFVIATRKYARMKCQ